MKTLAASIIENYISASLGITVNEGEDPVKKHYEEFGEKWIETHDLDTQFEQLRKKTKDTSNIGLADTWVVDDEEHPYYIVKLHGGLNGNGNWHNYLKDIQYIINEFKDKAYIIKLDVDVPDDVWDLYLGIKL